MADIIAVTFDGADEAEATLRTIRALEAEGKIKPSDTAVVRKDQDGKVTLHNEGGSGTETGAVAGGLIGRAAAPGIDGKWVKEVSEDLPNGGSALFLQMREAERGLVI